VAQETETVTIKLLNVRHPFHEPADLRDLILQKLGVPAGVITGIRILRRSVDARQERLDIVYTLAVEIEASAAVITEISRRDDVEPYTPRTIQVQKKITGIKKRPLVIGCGPAGLFAAHTLAERGVPPVVIERGAPMDQRIKDVNAFWKNGTLSQESNVFFGEGGAGTFSDGKLTTRIKSALKENVLRELVQFGAPEEILYLNKPHLGTDRIRQIIQLFVKHLEHRGVEFIFNTRITGICIEHGMVTGVSTKKDFIETETVFLATGHSARDVYAMLRENGVKLEAKGFAVGLRIEHPQEFINTLLWKHWAGTPGLGPADYFISYHDTETGRGVYSFCMCPGGFVIACSSQLGEVSTNGMSAYRRASPWANSAIVVTVSPEDFACFDPLAGIAFQRELEKKAAAMGGENFFIPIQKARDFAGETKQGSTTVQCSCRPGVRQGNLKDLLPAFIGEPLRRALYHYDKKMPGFIAEGCLFGVESRTSSPVRIQRNPHTFQAIGITGLFPIGEGAGYAGGIISSAVDGIRAAQHFDRN
jgi:hypothetical protein